MRWPGGSANAFLNFIPNAFAYFLVCLHCNSRKRLQVVVLMLLFVCLFPTAQGYVEQVRGFPEGALLEPGFTGSPYLLAMKADSGEWLYRLRGLGEIHDPNDFAQLIVCVIPLMFIFWRAKKTLRNVVCVLLPVGVLLFGVYLTHSRGALIALMAVTLVAARRRIGTLPALVMAGGLFVAAMALHFTGGRAISAESGSDRTALWSNGLQMLKSHPLFGVGFGNFADNAGLTAHNSIVVCAAELGLVGLYFWSLFLFSTIRDALIIASPAKVSEGDSIVFEEGPHRGHAPKPEDINRAEINNLGQLVLLSLTGFLVAGLFLSRAYVLTLFLLGGMAEAVYEMALSRKMIAPRLSFGRVLPRAGVLAISLVLLMYITVRTLSIAH
jgi:hypothetical protein